MRLFLFSASVFFLLGLKLTSQIEIKSSLNSKSEIKRQIQPPELKPELIKKDSANSAETKSVLPTTNFAKKPKSNAVPQS